MRFSNSFSTALTGALITGLALFAGLSMAKAADIDVTIDQARIVNLKSQATGVIVGNPSIADVSVQNGRLLVVTGKSVGVTNIIVLDSQDQQILSGRIAVKHDTQRIVTVLKGVHQFSYSCKPTCRPVLLPGDHENYFEPLAKATRNKLGIAQAVVDGSQAPQ